MVTKRVNKTTDERKTEIEKNEEFISGQKVNIDESVIIDTTDDGKSEKVTKLSDLTSHFDESDKKLWTEAQVIADLILKSDDRLRTALMLFDILPPKLVRWINWVLRSNDGKMTGTGTTDICISETLDSRLKSMPGDLIIRSQIKFPKTGDTVEICAKTRTGEYVSDVVKVLKVQMVDNTVRIQSMLTRSIGNVSMNNVMCTFKVIKYGTPEWIAVVRSLELDFNPELLISVLIDAINQLKSIPNIDKNVQMITEANKVIKDFETRINELRIEPKDIKSHEFESYIG